MKRTIKVFFVLGKILLFVAVVCVMVLVRIDERCSMNLDNVPVTWEEFVKQFGR